MKIGFFDSGLGGLLILKAVAKALPQYDYLYYGDTKNLPYGDKPEAEIFALTAMGVAELFKRDCALVVIACNTASAETLRKLQDTYLVEHYPDRRILGVIIPTIEKAVSSKAKKILLLATKRTVDSGKYDLELVKRVGGEVSLSSLAVPELVPLIEAGKREQALVMAKRVVVEQEAKNGAFDTVILGCTHYTLLKEGLRQEFKDKFNFIAQDEVIPQKLKEYLANHSEIETKLSQGQSRTIVLTEHRADYDQITKELLDATLIN